MAREVFDCSSGIVWNMDDTRDKNNTFSFFIYIIMLSECPLSYYGKWMLPVVEFREEICFKVVKE